jgi:hypothetical protein
MGWSQPKRRNISQPGELANDVRFGNKYALFPNFAELRIVRVEANKAIVQPTDRKDQPTKH